MRLMFRATHASCGGIIIGDVGSWTGIDWRENVEILFALLEFSIEKPHYEVATSFSVATACGW